MIRETNAEIDTQVVNEGLIGRFETTSLIISVCISPCMPGTFLNYYWYRTTVEINSVQEATIMMIMMVMKMLMAMMMVMMTMMIVMMIIMMNCGKCWEEFRDSATKTNHQRV